MKQGDIKRIFNPAQIAETVERLARQINRDYKGREVILVGCLTGAFVFMADLMRNLQIEATCDFIRVSSYEDRMTAGEISLESDLARPVGGGNVIVVEDIVDTGQTMKFIMNHLREKGAASIEVCSLLYKESDRSTLPKEDIRYLGLVVPDVFVVGYGIDYAQKFRTLNYIGSIEPS